MGPAAVARMLAISYSTARNYLNELEWAGVGVYDTEHATELRLEPAPEHVDRFLASLTDDTVWQRVSLRRSVSRHSASTSEYFLHVLADDVRFPLARYRGPARRDPLVAALFGEQA